MLVEGTVSGQACRDDYRAGGEEGRLGNWYSQQKHRRLVFFSSKHSE